MATATVDKRQREIQEELLNTLGALGGVAFKDEDIKFEGSKLIIPANMTLPQAEKFIRRKREEEEKITSFSRTFKYRPFDGAFCTWKALKKAFGAVGHPSSTIQTFFGPMKSKPELHTIQTAPGHTEQVPWGNFTLPFMPGCEIGLGEAYDAEFGPLFHITVEGPRKFRYQVEGIFRLIEAEMESGSMYKGQPIDGKPVPDFLDLSGVDPNKVVYTDEVRNQLDANINSPLRYADATRDHGLPLKRSVLIYGPYGTGKTLAAFLTAKTAVEEGWTFIYARPGKDDLAFVMQTAKLYQPAVVFFEDMDKVASSDEEGDQMTKMLDTFDGITAKGTEIMVILTTNHPDRIHKGMVRPGRLDAVIKIDSLDDQGIENLIKALIPESMMSPTVDFEAIGESMNGYLPAFVKEATDRTMRYAINRSGGETENIVLETDDFVYAANGLREQLTLMEDAKDVAERDSLGEALKRHVEVSTEKTVRATVRPDLLVPDE